MSTPPSGAQHIQTGDRPPTATPAVRCFEYELSEAEALQKILQIHRRSAGLNNFSRILLALDLEPELREKARLNQQAGGQRKGSSKLTEAGKVDVRTQIALLAAASAGTVEKVKHLKTAAHQELLFALRAGEISVHQAWIWSKLSVREQCEALMRYRSERGVHRTIRVLLSRHRPKVPAKSTGLSDLVNRLAALEMRELDSIEMTVVRSSGRMLCVTEELLAALGLQGHICFPSSH